MWSAIATIIAAIIGKVFEALRMKRQDEDRVATHERAATAEAGLETSEAIDEITAARADVPEMPEQVEDIARELRSRKKPPQRPF